MINLKSHVHSIIVLSVLFITGQSYSQTVPLSPELNKKLPSKDLISDLDSVLVKVYEKEYNRSPFNFISEDEFKKQVKIVREYFLANDSLSRVDFFKKVGPLLTLLKDDHSTLKLVGDWTIKKLNNSLSEEHFVFPLSTLIYDGSCYVAASDTIPIKSKIISINNIPIMDIVKKTLQIANFSEYNAATKNVIASFDFPKYAVELWALYNFNNKVEIKYIPYGEESEKKITLSLFPFYDKTMTKKWKIMPIKMERNPSVQFKNNIAILRLPSFLIGKNAGGDLRKWLDFFDKSFKEINSVKPKKLLIDIGNNGGGSESVGYILLNYLYDAKIKTSFYSNEYTPSELFNENIIPIIGDSLKNKIKFTRYEGEIYLLISEMTFSAAARFADLFKTFSIGKIIGRETRGYRTHYGEVKYYDLAKTGIGVSISSKFFVSASGDMEPHGVIPDYEIKINNVDELFSRFGNDYLLQEAVKYLSK
jgi:hypothetical protein